MNVGEIKVKLTVDTEEFNRQIEDAQSRITTLQNLTPVKYVDLAGKQAIAILVVSLLLGVVLGYCLR